MHGLKAGQQQLIATAINAGPHPVRLLQVFDAGVVNRDNHHPTAAVVSTV